jgi:hypothetical protein
MGYAVFVRRRSSIVARWGCDMDGNKPWEPALEPEDLARFFVSRANDRAKFRRKEEDEHFPHEDSGSY